MAEKETKIDYKKLSAEQLEVAKMIIEECELQGVNPDIVLPMAYIESRFKQSARSDKGAIGVMQLMPGTAKEQKVNPLDVRENIRGGVKFIGSLLENPDVAYDPLKLVVAYHDGPNSAYFKTGDPKKISQPAIEYADMFNKLSGGIINPKMAKAEGEAAPETAAPSEAAPVAAPVVEEPVAETDSTWSMPPPPPPDTKPQQQTFGFHPAELVTGAGLGAGTGATLGATRKAIGAGQTVSNLAQAVTQAAESMAQQPGKITGTGLPPAQGPAQRTPLGGKGTFNYGKAFGMTDFDAARALDMSKSPGGALDVARQVREAETKIGPGYKMTPERADLLLPEQVGSGPRGARTVPIPPPQGPGPLQRAMSNIRQFAGASPMMSSTLGGLGAGAMAAEAAERYRTGDVPGAGLGAMGSVGSIMSMIPKTSVPGAAMSVASPIAMALADYIRNRKEKPFEPIQISEGLMKDLKATEEGIRANIAKRQQPDQAPQGGFSLPAMAP